MISGRLHRLLVTGMAASALIAFLAGAGAEAPSAWAALPLLVWAALRSPSERLASRIELAFRGGALVLAVRAAWTAFRAPGGVVLPMVDLLLFLLCGEAWRRREATSDARLYSLSIALLVAAAAYRPGPAFAIAFVAFIVLATLGLTVGHIHRQSEARGVAPPALRPGFLLRLAGLSTVVLISGLLVFLAFPRYARGWAGRPPAPARVVVGFSDEVGLGAHGATIEANPTVVLRVEFEDTAPPHPRALYWRGRSYDRFDGVRWSRSNLPPVPPTPARPADRRVVQRVRAIPLDAPVVFGMDRPVQARARSRITIYRDTHGDLGYIGRNVAPVYEVVSETDRPAPDSLRRLPAGLPPAGAYYLQLPRIAARIRALADSISAGADNPYDRSAAIESWLRSSFDYTVELPGSPREATLEHFLFVRRAGHCEYFSTAMVVLLRTLGIPARNVNGFLGGEWNPFGGYMAVTQNQAHSWVEVWLPGAGWTSFDPTPPGEAAGASAPAPRFPGLHRLLDGLAFRWSAWVLDYGLEDQFALIERALDVWTPDRDLTADPETQNTAPARRLAGALLVVMGAVVVLVLVTRLRRRPRRSPESRAYRRLREAYRRAGFDPGGDAGPLAFSQTLTLRAAPGAAPARRAVALYLAARFGPPEARPAPGAVRTAVAEALRELRSVRLA